MEKKEFSVKRQITLVIEYVQVNNGCEVCKLLLPNGQCLAVFDDASQMAAALVSELRQD